MNTTKKVLFSIFLLVGCCIYQAIPFQQLLQPDSCLCCDSDDSDEKSEECKSVKEPFDSFYKHHSSCCFYFAGNPIGLFYFQPNSKLAPNIALVSPPPKFI